MWYDGSTSKNAHLTASTTQRSVRSSVRRLSTLADDEDDEPSSVDAILCAAGNKSNSENCAASGATACAPVLKAANAMLSDAAEDEDDESECDDAGNRLNRLPRKHWRVV